METMTTIVDITNMATYHQILRKYLYMMAKKGNQRSFLTVICETTGKNITDGLDIFVTLCR